jgi:4-amino-4-deoxy-L-arabinose transferase-like glycosyltransferase
VFVVAAAQLAVLILFSRRYGYHGDEMYFVVSGQHPAFGYPDQPPLVPLLCAAMNALAPHSLLLLRLPSALVSAGTTVLAGVLARDLGGSMPAQTLAAGATASSGYALAVGHTVSTATFDMLGTTLLMWCLIRALMARRPLLLLLAGLVVGVGTEAKPQVALVAMAAIAALAVVGPRWPLRTWQLWAGGLVALAVAAPYILWQAGHGWPQVTVAHNIAGDAEGGRAGFVPFQLVMVGLFLTPLWLVGLVAPFRRRSLAFTRVVPVTYGVMAALYLVGDGKAYYLASFYPTLLAVGAVPTTHWLRSGRSWLRGTALGTAFVLTLAINIPAALPLLRPDQLQGSLPMALNPDMGNTVGWPAFISTVAATWRSLPDRGHTAIFAFSYEEASAVDLLGGSHGLPSAYSGHNGFSLWAQPAPSATRALLLGYDGPRDAAPYFRDCRVLARIDNHVGLDNDEEGLPVMVCRPVASWAELWPHLRHYQ